MSDEDDVNGLAGEDDAVEAADAAPEDVETGEKAPAADGPKADAAGDEPAGDEEPDDDREDEPRKRRNRHSPEKRIGQLTRQRHEAQALAEKYRREAEELRKKAAPRETDYENYDDFEAAKAEWVADRTYAKVAERQADEAKARADEADREAKREAFDGYRQRAAAFAAQVPDYEKVAHTAPISDDVAFAVIEMEASAPVAYYLGKHHDEARALSALPHRQMLIELANVTARAVAEAAEMQRAKRVVSNAPPPIAPATGAGGAPAMPDLAKAPYQEYVRLRRAEMERG